MAAPTNLRLDKINPKNPKKPKAISDINPIKTREKPYLEYTCNPSKLKLFDNFLLSPLKIIELKNAYAGTT